ncbi:MAG: 4'-phosphopantetheinyl transferase superfamily protein [Clostridiales bacterium]|nr:4'-phosphopantetheinyl transferase superfamily protein [Clostridiales bacterium]
MGHTAPETDIYIYRTGGSKPAPSFLSRAAACHTGLAPDPLLWSVRRAEQGKPYFPNMPALFFSISHSGGFWMCAFSSRPVGLDLQRHQPCNRAALSRRFFHPEEDKFLRQCDYRAFFPVWSAKESYVKFTGQGIVSGLGSFSVADGRALRSTVNGARLRHLFLLPGYSLCLCTEGGGPLRLALGR